MVLSTWQNLLYTLREGLLLYGLIVDITGHFMLSEGFIQSSPYFPCVYVRELEDNLCFILVSTCK